jgi:folate-dependent phosphoribosylglycinamide formyltransferase PurN
MRIVVLCSSPYSETGCAMAAGLAQFGHTPVGALTLPAWNLRTLVRKVGQWGFRESALYARAKLARRKISVHGEFRNPYLAKWLTHGEAIFRSLQDVASCYHFPVSVSSGQNSPAAIRQLQQWSPDLVIFTGGDILRKALLNVPRLGVINAHLALLPEIRGMSSPEWSLLCDVPIGITIHYMDAGIDTGPVLLRRPFADAGKSDSLVDLRNRMIATGIELVGETITALDQGTISPAPQRDRDKDTQFFVMHDWLKARAARHLKKIHLVQDCVRSDG